MLFIKNPEIEWKTDCISTVRTLKIYSHCMSFRRTEIHNAFAVPKNLLWYFKKLEMTNEIDEKSSDNRINTRMQGR